MPELADLDNKEIHEPPADKANKSGYPAPLVYHKECRERALEAYKAGLARDM